MITYYTVSERGTAGSYKGHGSFTNLEETLAVAEALQEQGIPDLLVLKNTFSKQGLGSEVIYPTQESE